MIKINICIRNVSSLRQLITTLLSLFVCVTLSPNLYAAIVTTTSDAHPTQSPSTPIIELKQPHQEKIPITPKKLSVPSPTLNREYITAAVNALIKQIGIVMNTRNANTIYNFFHFYTAPDTTFVINTNLYNSSNIYKAIATETLTINTDQYVSYLQKLITKSRYYSCAINITSLKIISLNNIIVTFSMREVITNVGDSNQNIKTLIGNAQHDNDDSYKKEIDNDDDVDSDNESDIGDNDINDNSDSQLDNQSDNQTENSATKNNLSNQPQAIQKGKRKKSIISTNCNVNLIMSATPIITGCSCSSTVVMQRDTKQIDK